MIRKMLLASICSIQSAVADDVNFTVLAVAVNQEDGKYCCTHVTVHKVAFPFWDYRYHCVREQHHHDRLHIANHGGI